MFSAAVERALHVSIVAHEGQFRKGGEGVPYAVHPIHVAVMLIRFGHDDEVVQAGLLHDVVEDVEDWTVERLREEFGQRVASIVGELTEDKSKSWEERKRHAIDKVPTLSTGALHVKACDKLHNLQSLRAQLEAATDPEGVWGSFHGGRDRTLAMDAELLGALAERVDEGVRLALAEAHEAIRRLAQIAGTGPAGR